MTCLIAHRGSHADVSENTLAAFEAAAERGADMIEFDVRRTADGALAIFHDPEVARTALGKLTLAELRTASGVAVPVLEEVLAWAQDAHIGVDVELKEDGYVDAVAPLLENFDGPLMVTSFLDPVLAQLARSAPEVTRGLLLSLTTMGAVRRVRQCHAQAAVIEMKLLGDGRVLDGLAEADLGAYLWDFLPERHERWLADGRVAGFITDDVPASRAALALALS
jgi:glycerophosphoryl diester phosphodiesterase